MPTASSNREPSDGGYATAAAAIISLALALVATAVLTGTLTQLRGARVQLSRTQAEAKLDSAHLLAAYRITANTVPGRLRWAQSALGSEFEVLAEPEADKIAVARLSDPTMLAPIGASNPISAWIWLNEQEHLARPLSLAEADPAQQWRECAPSALSNFGRADHIRIESPHAPVHLGERSHVGEIWRVVVSSDDWVDERLVRLTGNSNEPAITIERRLRRAATLDMCPEGMSL